MATITLRDSDGNDHKAQFRFIEDHGDASIGVATMNADDTTFHVPAVVYDDGTVICFTDWQVTMDDDEIIQEATDPMWSHHWAGPNGEPAIILDGLPRLFG